MDEVDERFAPYAETIIEITLSNGASVRVLPGHIPPVELADLLPLFVITAWNPAGPERPGATSNNAAHQELLQRLGTIASEGTSLVVLPAVGRAVDDSHSEASAAVHGLAKSDAIDLARRMRQDAIFEITGSGTDVIDCNG